MSAPKTITTVERDGCAIPHRKAQPFVHRDWCDQFDLHRDVVARHHHLGALRQMHRSRHRRRAEVKLRPVIPKKRRVSPALLLGQDIGLALKAGIGLGFDRADAL